MVRVLMLGMNTRPHATNANYHETLGRETYRLTDRPIHRTTYGEFGSEREIETSKKCYC